MASKIATNEVIEEEKVVLEKQTWKLKAVELASAQLGFHYKESFSCKH